MFLKFFERDSIPPLEECLHGERFFVAAKPHAGDAKVSSIISQIRQRDHGPRVLPRFFVWERLWRLVDANRNHPLRLVRHDQILDGVLVADLAGLAVMSADQAAEPTSRRVADEREVPEREAAAGSVAAA